MAKYIPKSKVNILQTTGTEFINVSTNQVYIGSYMELSNGTFFAGSNSSNPGEKLIRIKPQNTTFAVSKNNTKYRKLNRSIYDELSKKLNIPISKPQPIIKDYEQGYFTRYFCRRVNDTFNYFEISKKTYDNLFNQNDKYDYNLHIIGEIKWVLLDTPSDFMSAINNNNVKLLLDTYPYLNILFNNLDEYEPLHTKTFKEKLYKKDKILYTGYFHIHPTNGSFMEGPFHSPKLHEKIFTMDQLQFKGKSNYTPSTNLGTTQIGPTRGSRGSGGGRVRTSTSSGGSTSGGSSGGGGGGY